jgi:hypothetical protein
VFFDDILVYNRDISTYINYLTQVLDKLVSNKLKAKWSKCAFGSHNQF